MKKIEQLKTDVDELKKTLDELKNNVTISDVEKKNKVVEIKNKAEKTKKKIESEINSLSNKTDEESKKIKEEAEALLESFNEIMGLYASILNFTSSQHKSKEDKSVEEKGFFEKTKNWIGNQWNDMRDKDKRKSETGKNLLRTVGFIATGVGAIGMAYKGVKKIWSKFFGDDTKEEEPTTKGKQDTGDSFRNGGLGKVLKRGSLSSAIGGGFYYFYNNWFGDNEAEKSIDIANDGSDEISDAMFQQLLYMEGTQDFVARSHKKTFGENFVTGPYGMVYKHIDEDGNGLGKPIPFKDGERVSKEWAKKNAKAYYNKRGKERSDLLNKKGYKYTQDMLDALVSASGGTEKSVKRLKEFVLSHWDDKDAIFNFMSKFATTAAGNGKTMPGLVIRRDFEANWFKGKKEPLSNYQRRYYQDRHYA